MQMSSKPVDKHGTVKTPLLSVVGDTSARRRLVPVAVSCTWTTVLQLASGGLGRPSRCTVPWIAAAHADGVGNAPVGVGVSIGVAVRVNEGVADGMAVGVSVGVRVGVLVGVRVGLTLAESVALGVLVNVGVEMLVAVGVGVRVGVLAGVAV